MGVGFVTFFFYLKKKKIKFKEYYGYDINKKILKYLKDKNIKNLKLSSIFPKKKVDIIIMILMLENLMEINQIQVYLLKRIEVLFILEINGLIDLILIQ